MYRLWADQKSELKPVLSVPNLGGAAPTQFECGIDRPQAKVQDSDGGQADRTPHFPSSQALS